MMRMLNNYLNLEMTKGDTLSFCVEIFDIGQELETAYFTCKNNYDDETNVFQKTLSNGITLVDIEGNNYFYVVRIDPRDTKDLQLGKYHYDMQIEANRDVFTIMKGILTIEYDVNEECIS